MFLNEPGVSFAFYFISKNGSFGSSLFKPLELEI